MAEDAVPLGNAAQGVEVPYGQMGRESPAGQVSQAAIGGDEKIVFSGRGELSGLHGSDDDAQWGHGGVLSGRRGRRF